MSVGNDIVDLSATAGIHPRFIERVCTAEERLRIEASSDPKRMLWSLFAAKEAAYKAAVKLGLEPGFAHRRFEVSPDFDSVRFEDRSFALRMEHHEDWVHAIVGEATITGIEEGSSARDPLMRALKPMLGDVSITREPKPGSWDGFGPPRVMGADVSLSHDGRFVAFVAAFS